MSVTFEHSAYLLHQDCVVLTDFTVLTAHRLSSDFDSNPDWCSIPDILLP